MTDIDKDIREIRAREKFLPDSLENPEKPLTEDFWMYALAKEKRGSMINLQIISTCQLKCTFCRGSIDKTQLNKISKNSVMQNSDFIEIVDKCVSAGVVYFELTPAVGEPFLDDTLFDKLDYLEQNPGVDIFLVTSNLLKVNEEQVKRLLKYKKLLFAVSVYGYDNESYTANTGQKFFDKFMQNIELLYSCMKQSSGYHVEFSMRYGDKYKDLPKNRLYYILMLLANLQGVRVDNSEIPNINRGGSIEYGKTVNERQPEDVKRSGICPHGPGLGGGILPNGDLLFCPFNDINRVGKMGNIHEQGLNEIYSSDKWKQLVADHSKDIYNGICEKCNESW